MKGDAVSLDVRGEPDSTRLVENAAQEPLAILQRDLEERPSVEIKQIEDLVHQPRRRTLARAA